MEELLKLLEIFVLITYASIALMGCAAIGSLIFFIYTVLHKETEYRKPKLIISGSFTLVLLAMLLSVLRTMTTM